MIRLKRPESVLSRGAYKASRRPSSESVILQTSTLLQMPNEENIEQAYGSTLWCICSENGEAVKFSEQYIALRRNNFRKYLSNVLFTYVCIFLYQNKVSPLGLLSIIRIALIILVEENSLGIFSVRTRPLVKANWVASQFSLSSSLVRFLTEFQQIFRYFTLFSLILAGW